MQTVEKPKFKHNKKRNTAFLFEALVKELTKAVIEGNKNKQKNVTHLIKEHFKKNSALDRELTLYKQFYDTKQFPKQHAEKLVSQVKIDHEKLDENEIFNEQSKLIAKVNKMLGFEVYNNFVPNYKTLATVSQIFNKQIEPKKRVLLENDLIEHITREDNKQDVSVEKVDAHVLNVFVDKFNKAYSENLLPEQKEVLSRFISCTEDDVEIKIYLNEEIDRLKNLINNTKNINIIKENKDLEIKINKAYNFLNNLKVNEVDEELIKKIMLIQEFVSEVNK